MIGLVSYSIYVEPPLKTRVPIEKTWRSLITNCGFQMQMENSLNANMFYERYENIQWNLDKAIFISMDQPGIANHVTMKVKMNPTQFKDPDT